MIWTSIKTQDHKDMKSRIAEMEAKAAADRKYMDKAETRIAELEAENEALVETQRRKVVLLLGDREKAERALKQAEAERDVLNARRCEGCHWTRNCSIEQAGACPGFSCNRWQLREGGDA